MRRKRLKKRNEDTRMRDYKRKTFRYYRKLTMRKRRILNSIYLKGKRDRCQPCR